MPVSYTHLDVYKRQPQESAAPEIVPDGDSKAAAGTKKVVTRASIIGEEQQRLRAEEDRRNSELRARQELSLIHI